MKSRWRPTHTNKSRGIFVHLISDDQQMRDDGSLLGLPDCRRLQHTHMHACNTVYITGIRIDSTIPIEYNIYRAKSFLTTWIATWKLPGGIAQSSLYLTRSYSVLSTRYSGGGTLRCFRSRFRSRAVLWTILTTTISTLYKTASDDCIIHTNTYVLHLRNASFIARYNVKV